MKSDYYSLICERNVRSYGIDIGQAGKMPLPKRFDERRRVIDELLRTAEDPFGRSEGWAGGRTLRVAWKDPALRSVVVGRISSGPGRAERIVAAEPQDAPSTSSST